MRLIAFLPYISLLSSCAYASPVGYNLRRHEDSYQGGKQFITTVMVITRTMTLEIDLPPMTTAPDTTESIPPPAKSTAPPEEDTPEVTVTEIVTVTNKKTTTVRQDPAPSTTESLSRLNPLPTTEKVEAPKTTTCTDTTKTSAPVPDITEQPSPSPEVPTLQPTSTYSLSRLNPLPVAGRPDRASETPTPPSEPTTTETPTSKTTIAETTTPEPAPTSTPQPEKPSSSQPEAPKTTGFVPPTDPENTGPFLKENVPLAIKRNQEYSGIKEGDECDPSAYLLACAGTMGKSILQCGATKTYEAVVNCARDDRCFATPQLLAPGIMVTCDTPENAGKKFNMSADELLKEIGNGEDKGKGKEKDDKDGYRRKRRASTSPKRTYREIHYRS